MGPRADAVVVPDDSGECEEALKDSGDHASGGAPTVTLEIELALQGVVDGLDDLAERLQEPSARTRLLVDASGSNERGVVVLQELLELVGPVALVGEDHLAGAGIEEVGLDLQEVTQHLTLVGLRVRQGESDRQPSDGGDEVQPEPPEVARVAGAVAVASKASEPGAA